MDAFVKSTPQKKDTRATLHEPETRRLREYIDEGKNVFICGPSGSGKTFIVDNVLNNSNSIELHLEMFSKKNILFTETRAYMLIDGYENSIHAFKQLVDKISDGGRGSLVVTSTDVHMLPNFELIVVPRRTPDAIASLTPENPGAHQAALKCQGNIQNFFDYLAYSDTKDVFKSSKEIVADILCTPGPFDFSQTIHEHGHICDVIHGNYLSTKGCDAPNIMESLSIADTYDTLMYKGEWGYMPYYICSGIATPKYYMGSELQPDSLKAGSSWTKYGNYKMRQQKLKNIQCNHSTQLSIDELSVIRQYAASGNLEPLTDYKLAPSDFDVMNHLALGNKMKPNEVMRVKKKMRSLIK
jgi:ABC-type dipeptide/oligopeptide/nickel transport system ATPase subunit